MATWRVPAGYYAGPFFPQGTRVLVDETGTAWKVWDDGRRERLDIHSPRWIYEYVRSGHWVPVETTSLAVGA